LASVRDSNRRRFQLSNIARTLAIAAFPAIQV
jgi:hypothetical protein